jgi:hypothetical protein
MNMRRRLRILAIGLTIVAASMTAPGAARASSWTDGPTIWTNALYGSCLGVGGGKNDNGTAILSWPCNGSDDQMWWAEPTEFGDYLIRNGVYPYKCISVAAKSKNDQARLVIWDCKHPRDNQDQRWSVYGARLPGAKIFSNFNSGLAMGLRNGWPFQGPEVVQEGAVIMTDMLWFDSPA